MRSAVFVSDPTHMLRVLRIADDLGIDAYGSPTDHVARPAGPLRRAQATIHELGALAVYFLSGGTPTVEAAGRLKNVACNPATPPWNAPTPAVHSGSAFRPRDRAAPNRPIAQSRSSPRRPVPNRHVDQRKGEERGNVKQAEEAQFVDLIACERDCRTCSYAAALDCDGNCGVCPHNSYCPCVNPVVARSKTALRLIELRPILLQEAQVRA